MKKIGLIGGMSWESSQEYYRILNTRVKELLGGFHSCNCILESVDFAEVEKLQHKGDWHKLEELMVKSALNLERAGAEIIVLCTNTMHAVCNSITKKVNIPFLHIADATGAQIKSSLIDKVLLLGTRFTMEQDFYKNILSNDYGVSVEIPTADHRQKVHHIIYSELVKGIFRDSSRETLLQIIDECIEKGVKGVVLGCTELPLLLKQDQVTVPLFDTTALHAEAALRFALS